MKQSIVAIDVVLSQSALSKSYSHAALSIREDLTKPKTRKSLFNMKIEQFFIFHRNVHTTSFNVGLHTFSNEKHVMHNKEEKV